MTLTPAVPDCGGLNSIDLQICGGAKLTRHERGRNYGSPQPEAHVKTPERLAASYRNRGIGEAAARDACLERGYLATGCPAAASLGESCS